MKPSAVVVLAWAVQQNLANQGATPLSMTPAEFDAFMRAETAKWAKVVQASGARAD